jgi:hypothetical protein
VERRAGFTGEVELAVEGIPSGVKTTLENIAAKARETTFKLTATDKAPVGTNTLTVVARGLHRDRNYKHRSGPITLVITVPEPAILPTATTASNAPPVDSTK